MKSVKEFFIDIDGTATVEFDGSLKTVPLYDSISSSNLISESNQITPQMFGAIGNGVVDDTIAMQNWFNFVASNNTSGYLPKGRYKITSPIVYEVSDNSQWIGGFSITGASPSFARDGNPYGSVIEPTNAVTDAAIVILGKSNSNNSNSGQLMGVTLQNFGIRGNEGGSNGHGIRVKYWTNINIRNVHIHACKSGLKLERQANGVTFGYGNNSVIENLFVTLCREYGIDATDEGAVVADFRSCNLIGNTLGGYRISPGPSNVYGGLVTGNTGPGMIIESALGASTTSGPFVSGVNFESNASSPSGNYSTDLAQVVINAASCPVFIGNRFLSSTAEGPNPHSVKMGFTGNVNGAVFDGNIHLGRTAVSLQKAFIVGDLASRNYIRDREISGYSGSSSRATSAQIFGNSSNKGFFCLGVGNILEGGQTISNSTATPILENADIPLGTRGFFEISSQGGGVYATGIIIRGRDGVTTSVVTLSSSANCSLSIVSNSVRVTQTSGSSLQMFWSLHIQAVA